MHLGEEGCVSSNHFCYAISEAKNNVTIKDTKRVDIMENISENVIWGHLLKYQRIISSSLISLNRRGFPF